MGRGKIYSTWNAPGRLFVLSGVCELCRWLAHGPIRMSYPYGFLVLRLGKGSLMKGFLHG